MVLLSMKSCVIVLTSHLIITVTLGEEWIFRQMSQMLGHKDINTTPIHVKVTELKIAEDMKRLMKPPSC